MRKYLKQVMLLCSILSPLNAQGEQDYYSNYGQDSQSGAPTNEVSITTDQQYRYINCNGIPYWHGQFPNRGNPNAISPQSYHFRMSLNPQRSGRITKLWGGMDFGVGLDGVPFDPSTAEFWNGNPNWRYEAMSGKINLGMDANNAHVQPNGAYHYHGVPTELTAGQSAALHSAIVGYAADGFPLYARFGYADPKNPNSAIKELMPSYQLRTGSRPGGNEGPGGTYDGTFTADYVYVAGSGDLDECNGRFAATPDVPQGTYAYFITEKFPLIPRCFKGTPDQSFVKQDGRPPRPRPGMGPSGMGPPEMGPP